MRITTQMLNETAKRTGIPINQTNLLSYVNNESSGGNTLLDALNKNKTDKVSGTLAKQYKNLEKSSENLKNISEKLAETGAQSFFEKMKADGNTEKVYETVETYVKNYNETLKDLKKSTGILNQYYSEMLKEAASDNSEELQKIGISIGKDGALSIDSEKLKASSFEDIAHVFGASGDLTSKTAFLADKISANAQANIESTSSQYDMSGSLYSQFASKYDFWG